jgi:hypothetical protein
MALAFVGNDNTSAQVVQHLLPIQPAKDLISIQSDAPLYSYSQPDARQKGKILRMSGPARETAMIVPAS